LKGLIGKQRFFQTTGDGIVRGFDGEINLNETFAKLNEAKTKLTLGGSFVSKYQKDEDPILRLPENVGSWAGRFNIGRGKINVNGEYVYKYNDPSSINEFSYKFGDAALIFGIKAKPPPPPGIPVLTGLPGPSGKEGLYAVIGLLCTYTKLLGQLGTANCDFIVPDNNVNSINNALSCFILLLVYLINVS